MNTEMVQWMDRDTSKWISLRGSSSYLIILSYAVDAPRLHGGLTDGVIAGITITVVLIGVTIVVFAALMVYLIIARKRMTKPAISPDDG